MLTRRQLLRTGVTGAVAGSAVAILGCRDDSRNPDSVEPDFTAAFLTDPHVFADKGAEEGSRLAVQHALNQGRPPEFFITGGDLAFDIMEGNDRAMADAQYDLFDRAFEAVRVPLHHTIGNHDCFGVSDKSTLPTTDPLFGKGYFRERFGLDRTYASFDHEGWHFVILDTIGIEGRAYRGWIDDEQIGWLDDDLAASGKPTVIVGHIPLFSNFIEWRQGTSGGIPPGVSVVNAHRVAEVLVKHPVKLVLAGHLHINELFDYKGIRFANVGAVCGNWWDGLRDGFQEGYVALSFRGDRVEHTYIDYGWEVPEAVAAAI